MPLSTVDAAVERMRTGGLVLVLDDMDRENEGDLIMSAEKGTTEAMAFLIRHSSGYVCVPMLPERLDALRLPLMVGENEDPFRTAYAVTCDYKHGTTTGISAADRCLTAQKLADPAAQPADFIRPGHVLPLRARRGGVRERPGHTEAAVDLCRLAGVAPVGVICELVKPEDPQGNMARRDDCFAFGEKWDIPVITIEQLADVNK